MESDRRSIFLSCHLCVSAVIFSQHETQQTSKTNTNYNKQTTLRINVTKKQERNATNIRNMYTWMYLYIVVQLIYNQIRVK